ncbi:MAG TPA: CRTAC1 family protein [Candidatus Polarisedimenticolia bacterium]|jgi:hypothetical protein|nr:CRTAC1 family protein [Candidatus Polarisedimenticolia bacterium]
MEKYRGSMDAKRAVALLLGLMDLAAVVGCGAAAVDSGTAKGHGAAAEAPVADVRSDRHYPQFEDVTQRAGITSVHHKPDLDPKLGNIMNWLASVGAAVAAADYDGDGDIDLYVSDSRTGYPNQLYRNDGVFHFTDVAVEAGVARVNENKGTSMDAVFGDIDNDGHPDLYVVKWGCNVLFHNNGDGTFTDITRAAGVGDCGNGNAAVFVDYDLDGNLDLMVGNYFKPADLWHISTTRIMHDSFESSRNAGKNLVYHNNGDGTFTDVAHQLGMDDTGWTLDLGCGDIDNDGDQDCYIANDFGDDKLFRNEGSGTFSDITKAAKGTDTKKGMNVDFGDYNNDGFLDIYVTNITTIEYLHEGNMLWHNMGNGTFVDVADPAEVFEGGWGWCGKFLDYDNDGDLDIFTVNGFVSAGEGNYWYDLATMATTPDLDITDTRTWPMMGDRSFSGYEPSRLFQNDGPTFVEVAQREGITDTFDGRGIAVADLDSDGWPDLFVANQGARPTLYRNRGIPGRHWIDFDLRQTGRNTSAIGARVTLRSGGLTQIREVDGGNGYASQSSTILHFGLGTSTTVDEATIRWPDGAREGLRNLRPDSVVRRVHPFKRR